MTYAKKRDGSDSFDELVRPEEYQRRVELFHKQTAEVRAYMLHLDSVQSPIRIYFDDGTFEEIHSQDFITAMNLHRQLIKDTFEMIVTNGAQHLRARLHESPAARPRREFSSLVVDFV